MLFDYLDLVIKDNILQLLAIIYFNCTSTVLNCSIIKTNTKKQFKNTNLKERTFWWVLETDKKLDRKKEVPVPSRLYHSDRNEQF